MTPSGPEAPQEPLAGSSGQRPTLGDYLFRRIRESLDQALIDSHDTLDGLIKDAGVNAAGKITGNVGSLTSIIKDVVLTAVLSVTGPLEAVALAGDIEDAAGNLGTGYGLGYLLGSIGFQVLQPWMLPLIQESYRLSQFQTIDAGQAAAMYARRIVGQDFARGEGEKAGFSDNRIDLLAEAARRYPGLSEVIEMRRRGLIASGDAHLALQRAGVPDLYIPQLLALEQVLVGPADLALGLLRGNIQQADAEAYAARLGVGHDDLALLVGNTGEPPGLEEMLLAYRLNYIDVGRLEHGVRQSRVKNEWFDVVERLKYRPPPTADALRGAVQHFLPQDRAKEIARTNGLNPDEFQWLFDSYGEPIAKGEALELWRRGVLDQAHVEQALRESHLKDKWIPAVLELKRELIPIRQLLMIVMHGLKPPQWAIDILIQRGYDPEDAAALVAVETSGKAAVHKELAQGMIVELYEARAIGRQEALDDLAQLGWDAEQSQVILDLQDARTALAEQRKAITAVRKAFLASRIDQPTATHQLAELGVLDKQADTLIKDWVLELEGRVQQLTPGDIGDAAKYNGLTPEQAHEALVDMGYTRNGAWVYLAAHEVLPPKGVTITGPIS